MNPTSGKNLGWYTPKAFAGIADMTHEWPLARDLGMNPDSWQDMKEVLLLKADKRYHPSTRYGYARG